MTLPQERWLSKAREDLAVAKICLKEHFFNQVCFHAQQTAEKAIKAWITACDQTYPKSHDLLRLAAHLPQIQSVLSEELRNLQFLNQFYVPARYPDAPAGNLPEGMPNLEQTQKALQTAEEILRIAERNILEITEP